MDGWARVVYPLAGAALTVWFAFLVLVVVGAIR
jgi:hypothetical protein